MTRIAKIAIFAGVSKRNRDWLEDDFFDKAPTREALLYLAEHYRDVADTNTVCSQEDRAEFSRRAKYLVRAARELL